MRMRRNIVNYVGYMNYEFVDIEEQDEKVLNYISEIKNFINSITKEDLSKYKSTNIAFDDSDGYIKLEEEFETKYGNKMTFELSDKFVKESIRFYLAKFKDENIGEAPDWIKILLKKDFKSTSARIVINSYIRDAINNLDNK